MMSGNDTTSDQQIEQKNQTQLLKPKQKYRVICTDPTLQKQNQKQKKFKKSMITERLTYEQNEDFDKILDPQNLPYLNCIRCTNFIPQNLQSILSCSQTELTPFIIFQQDELTFKIKYSICAIANQGGGNIVIVKQYDNNTIKRGFPNNLIGRFQLATSKWIEQYINQINGSRYIQNQINCINISRGEQFALIITIKVDQQDQGRVFSYQQICYIIVKNQQFQIQSVDKQKIEYNQLRHRYQIVCKCIHGFKSLKENKLLIYQIPNTILYEPQKFFKEVCWMFLKYFKKDDFPKISYKKRALLLKIHGDHGQEILKAIKQIFSSAKITPQQYFPARYLQNKIKEFKKLKIPKAYYYQLRCLVFPNINFSYAICKMQLEKKLKQYQEFVQFKLFQKSIFIRESLNPNEINYLFKVIKQIFNFQPIRHKHYIMSNTNNCLKQMLNMKMKISFLVTLILNSANKTLFQ